MRVKVKRVHCRIREPSALAPHSLMPMPVAASLDGKAQNVILPDIIGSLVGLMLHSRTNFESDDMMA